MLIHTKTLTFVTDTMVWYGGSLSNVLLWY